LNVIPAFSSVAGFWRIAAGAARVRNTDRADIEALFGIDATDPNRTFRVADY
jgi:hypothetical protein